MNLTQSRRAAEDNELTGKIVDAAFHIHSDLGPGLLETAYEAILDHELRNRGHAVRRHEPVAIRYSGLVIDVGFRADLIVEDRVCVELKSVEKLAPVHSKQLLTYLKLLDYRVGLLLNFGAPLIKEGIVRIINSKPFRGSVPLRETSQ
jgi:GxxExxY protein